MGVNADHGPRHLVVVFGSTMFFGALLLFWIQPLYTKQILPLLGGTPSVWNTALVFFQASLLVGYAYVHASVSLLGARRQAMVHVVVIGLGLLVLPLAGPAGEVPDVEGSPVSWLLAILTSRIGLPFFALATTAPVLQAWFSKTDHPEASDPYFLYAASNAGSLLALMAFPFFLEPWIGLASQNSLWSAGFVVWFAGVAGCAVWTVTRKKTAESPVSARHSSDRAGSVSWRERASWIGLAFVPSGLLIAVTTYATTDLAAIPLLWVVPLALYLLTFVIAFSRRPVVPHRLAVRGMPFAVVLLVLALGIDQLGSIPALLLPLHLIAFFAMALVGHGELARRAPSAEHLTEFYLWIATGGVLGGASVALAAPVVLDSVLEYPLLVVLACLMLPVARSAPWLRRADLLPLIIVAVPIALLVMAGYQIPRSGSGLIIIGGVVVASALLAFGFRRRPAGFAGGVLVTLFVVPALAEGNAVVESVRGFFGVNKVMVDSNGYRLLLNGTTLHGVQAPGEGRLEPLSYFHSSGPFGQWFEGNGDQVRDVAVIGLGTGSTACYRKPGQQWTFYEIDPEVVRLARDSGHFDFLEACAPEARVVLGDARLSLANGEGAFDLIVMDAFSSDAVPVHLLTREAFRVYLDRLRPNGTLIVNISNRYLRLRPVLAAQVRDAGLVGMAQRWVPEDPERAMREYRLSSEWVVLSRTKSAFAGLKDTRWDSLESDPERAPWTDDFSNIAGILKWKF